MKPSARARRLAAPRVPRSGVAGGHPSRLLGTRGTDRSGEGPAEPRAGVLGDIVNLMQRWIVEAHGGPEALAFGEGPSPQPGNGEVQIKVRAVALNHLDLWVRNGVPGHRFPLPLVPGSEVAGTSSRLGAGVRDLARRRPGRRRPRRLLRPAARAASPARTALPDYGLLGEHRDGGYAELVVVPRRNVLPLPRGL